MDGRFAQWCLRGSGMARGLGRGGGWPGRDPRPQGSQRALLVGCGGRAAAAPSGDGAAGRKHLAHQGSGQPGELRGACRGSGASVLRACEATALLSHPQHDQKVACPVACPACFACGRWARVKGRALASGQAGGRAAATDLRARR